MFCEKRGSVVVESEIDDCPFEKDLGRYVDYFLLDETRFLANDRFCLRSSCLKRRRSLKKQRSHLQALYVHFARVKPCNIRIIDFHQVLSQ
jgi:hypothetical protein